MATVSVNIQVDQPHAEDEWFKSLPRPGPNASRPIQRFPQELRRNDEDKECYQPLAISIGPYHRKKKHLEPMQNLKASYAEQYIESKKSTTFGDLYGKVERVAAEARKCYAGDTTLDDMSDSDFTRMMFLDGCFILQFISGKHYDLDKKSSLVVQDLLLLENQLPFIVLKELEGHDKYNDLIKNTKNFFRNAVWYTPQPEAAHSSCREQPIHRLLHFLRLRAHSPVKQNDINMSTPQPETTHSSCRPQPIHRLLHFPRLRAHSPVKQNDNKMSTPQPETHSSPSPEPIHLLHLLRAYLLGNQNDNMSTPQPETLSSPSPESINLLHFLRAYLPAGNQNDNMVPRQPETQSCWCLPGNPSENTSNQRGDDESGDEERWHTFRSVKELNKAGIDVRVSRSHSISDVRFRSRRMWRGELELPPIFIYGGTKSILLNLVAYEMCCQDMFTEIPNVTSYICFLDHLIDGPEDVMELRSKGILKNFTGSDQEVADLFNTITRNFTPNLEAYKDVNQQIEDHRKSSIKMWFLNWIDTYFEAPWSVTSFVAAAIALLLTFMQTYLAFRESCKSQK